MTQRLPLADELSAVYAQMSGVLLSQETVDTAMGLITSLACECLPATVGAGVTLVTAQGGQRSAHASSELVEQADRAQYDLGEGPCLTAMAEGTVVRVDDIAGQRRWPRWTRAVEGLDLGASLSAPLLVGDDVLGALKVYSALPGGYDTWAERLVTMFAAQAAILLANVQASDSARRLSDELVAALRGRDVINQAMGVLMRDGGVGEEAAFAALVARSQRQGTALRDVAAALVAAASRAAR